MDGTTVLFAVNLKVYASCGVPALRRVRGWGLKVMAKGSLAVEIVKLEFCCGCCLEEEEDLEDDGEVELIIQSKVVEDEEGDWA